MTLTNTEINRKCAELMNENILDFHPTEYPGHWYDFLVWCMKQEWWRDLLTYLWDRFLSNDGEIEYSPITGTENFFIRNSLPTKYLETLEALPRAVVTFLEKEK